MTQLKTGDLQGYYIVPKLVNRNTEYRKSNSTPSRQLIFSLDRKYQRKRFMIRENIAKLAKPEMSTVSGDATRATPKMNVILMKPLPTIFPIARLK